MGNYVAKMDVVWRRKFGRKCHIHTNLNGVCANLVPSVTSEYQSGYYIVRINMPPMVCGSDHTASAAICKYTFLKALIRTKRSGIKQRKFNHTPGVAPSAASSPPSHSSTSARLSTCHASTSLMLAATHARSLVGGPARAVNTTARQAPNASPTLHTVVHPLAPLHLRAVLRISLPAALAACTCCWRLLGLRCNHSPQFTLK